MRGAVGSEGKMAAGPGSVSGPSGRGSAAALESSMDRRFQGVTNTMESIQGLSSWCIENKKHHSLVVRCWMKWLRKSDSSHRLNLFYLANDVIQNCKRRNAVIYRSAFADVLPNAALLVKDVKVCKSVDRIFSIWQERNVYPQELISELKEGLQKKEKEKKESPPPAPVNPKAALKSKIVAEFVPLDFVERLVLYQSCLEEEDLRENHLSALKMDISSEEALSRLKDKAGGSKFSQDFEEGSVKLQEFVAFLEKQLKAAPALQESLENAGIFYEMQYKEVKIIANAYKAFAGRVCNLKRKLDALKDTLPGDDSPVPPLSEDAPSPAGSESPLRHRPSAAAAAAYPTREPQKEHAVDMDMSEDDSVVADDVKSGKASLPATPKTTEANASQSSISKSSQSTSPAETQSPPVANQTTSPNSSSVASTPGSALITNSSPLQVNLANVDLGKISSILSSLSNVMKSTGVSPVSRPSTDTPATPSNAPSSTPDSVPTTNPLASILSKVSHEGILNVLTKKQTHSPSLQGLSSLLSSARSGSLSASDAAASSSNPSSLGSAAAASVTPSTPKTPKSTDGGVTRKKEREKERDRNSDRDPVAPAVALPSLESKINSFLQGNPGFSALGPDEPASSSPLMVGGDNMDGTPVRDESGGTPTQDEIMDTPRVPGDLSPTAYQSDPWDAVIMPRENSRKDRDYRLPPASQHVSFGPKAARVGEDDGLKRKPVAFNVFDSPDQRKKAKMAEELGKSTACHKTSAGSEDGAKDKKRKVDNGVHYHPIETRLSGEGAQGESLEYGNRIQTVESIRMTGRGLRRASSAASRADQVWYEDGQFMEPPPPRHSDAHERKPPEEFTPAPLLPIPAPPPPALQYQPPPYLHEDTGRPSHIVPSLHPPHPFFPHPSIPSLSLPPPPLPRDFPLSPTSTVMVGGVLVPIDRVLPFPPSNLCPDVGHSDGGGAPARGIKHPPLPNDPLRPGSLKEPFVLCHPHHLPGGLRPPLLSRIPEGLAPLSPPALNSAAPPSPAGEPRPLLSLPILLPTHRSRHQSSPPHLLHPPDQHHAPRSHHFPRGSQSQMSRPHSREPQRLGAKRGPFHTHKRPFQPHRY